MKSIAWLVKRCEEDEEYFGTVIANDDGSGGPFRAYALLTRNCTPEQRKRYLLKWFGRCGWGHLACGSYRNPPIVEVHPDPALP